MSVKHKRAIRTALAVETALSGSYVIYRKTFYNTDKQKMRPYRIPKGEQFQAASDQIRSLVSGVEAAPFEPVSIISHDGLRLFGRYYHIRDGAPMHIQFHGYRGNAARDFAGCKQCEWELGYNTLLVDERAHGRSDGHVIEFGVEERFDVADWAWYAADRFGADTPIVLSGASMGAAAVLMASNLHLPKNVVGIVADSPYDSPKDIICEVARKHHLPVDVMWAITYSSARVFGRMDLNAASAIESVRHTDLPILIYHGTADEFVPYKMSEEIAAATASEVDLEIFPGAAHCASFLVDPVRYVDAMKRFMTRVCR